MYELEEIIWWMTRARFTRKEHIMFTPQLPGIPLMAAMAREHQSDLLREAERGRLVRKAKSTRHDFLDRVLTGIGGMLISAGEKLRGRYAPAIGRLQLQ